MSRKLIVLLLVSLLALTCVFASKNTVNVQLSPFAYQKVKFEMGQEFKTTYGFGAKAGYRYGLTDNSSVGAFVSYANYKFDKVEDRYHVLSLMAELGTTLQFTKAFGIDVDFAMGTDYRIFRGEKHFYPAGSAYLGLSFNVTESIAVTAGAEFRLSDQINKIDAFSSTDTNLVYSLGSKINL